jgi:hypothetical protein
MPVTYIGSCTKTRAPARRAIASAVVAGHYMPVGRYGWEREPGAVFPSIHKMREDQQRAARFRVDQSDDHT